MVTKEINVRSLLNKSKISGLDYCINPYVGCFHGCVYCYARFMRRFTGHNENWGQFVDIKSNALSVLKREFSKKSVKGRVFLSSVTDAYQPIERKYQITRSILEVLLEYQCPISILTKSDLILRDIDILKQFHDCEVGLTITNLNDSVSKLFEPRAPDVKRRLMALRTLREQGIKTYVFIGPILPEFTNLKEIFSAIQMYTDVIMAESLNIKCGNWQDIELVLKTDYPHLLKPFYSKVISKTYWDQIGDELKELSKEFGLFLEGYYRH